MTDFKSRPTIYEVCICFSFRDQRRWTRWWRGWWDNAPRILGLEPPLPVTLYRMQNLQTRTYTTHLYHPTFCITQPLLSSHNVWYRYYCLYSVSELAKSSVSVVSVNSGIVLTSYDRSGTPWWLSWWMHLMLPNECDETFWWNRVTLCSTNYLLSARLSLSCLIFCSFAVNYFLLSFQNHRDMPVTVVIYTSHISF